MAYQIINQTKNTVIANKVIIAKSFFRRLVGLMFRKNIPADYCLAFYKSSALHTCFMRFPIDIIFLDKNMKVIKVVSALKPWRMILCFHSYITLELAAGRAAFGKVEKNDVLILTE